MTSPRSWGGTIGTYSIIQVTDDMEYSMTKAIIASSLTKSIFDTKTVMSAVVKNITPNRKPYFRLSVRLSFWYHNSTIQYLRASVI